MIINREQIEKVVEIRRVTKVVKGGKKMGFRALLVVGNEEGEVGVGLGKAGEVAGAIRKAVEDAKKNRIRVPRAGTTIPHRIQGKSGASQVILRPAPAGTGVIAGGSVRTVLELAGIRDVVAKAYGSASAINMSRATIVALQALKTPAEVERDLGRRVVVKWGEVQIPSEAAESV